MMMSMQDPLWQSFSRISEDLELLETHFQSDQQDVLKAQVAAIELPDMPHFAPVAPATEAVEAGDEDFLNTLADELAQRLQSVWADPAVVATFLQLAELRQDNETMAQELDALEHTHAAVCMENRLLKDQLAQFAHLIGPLHLKR